MYISPTPFLGIKDILQLFGYSNFSGQAWKSAPEEKVLVFSKGRWALQSFSSSFIKSKAKVKGTVFIPEYFCESSLLPLRMSNFNLVFYRINFRLEPDIDYLNVLIKKHGIPDILLYVHYFGVPSNLKNTADWCKTNGVLLIEDGAHSLLPTKGIGNHGFPVIYTPWKFCNSMEGAILVLPEELSHLLEEQQPQRIGFSCKWAVKKTVNSLAGRVKFPVHIFKKIEKSEPCDMKPLQNHQIPDCGRFSMSILASFEKELEKIRRIRESNYRRFDEAFSNGKTCASRLFHTVPEGIAPNVYPLRIQGDNCDCILRSLNNKGIPAQPWAELSPEVYKSSEFPMANALWQEILTLPVHQNISESQIDFMASQVIKCL